MITRITRIKGSVLAFGILSMTASCNLSVDELSSNVDTLVLNMPNLQNLGNEAHYEGWIVVEGTPVSTGTFTINDKGIISKQVFEINKVQLKNATKFILTIEPTPDNDKKPSKTKILAGVFNGKKAALSISDASALNTDLSGAKGGYILTTPSNGVAPPSQEESGIWFLDNSDFSSGKIKPSLTLPTLPEGWKYEGWVKVEGKTTFLSTGKFKTTNVADENGNKYAKKGVKTLPPFPGEDFLENSPSGFTFPLDIRGGSVIISVEPNPDNNESSPFFLRPLYVDVTKTQPLKQFSLMRLNKITVWGTAERILR